MKLRALLLTSALALAATACATGGQPLTMKQKIGFACADVQAAGETIANGADHGFISQADAGKAATLYHSTDRFCEPVVSTLSAADYASLLSTAAALLGTASKVKTP